MADVVFTTIYGGGLAWPGREPLPAPSKFWVIEPAAQRLVRIGQNGQWLNHQGDRLAVGLRLLVYEPMPTGRTTLG